MKFDYQRVDTYDPHVAEIIQSWGVSLAPYEMLQMLAEAARRDGARPGDPCALPVWCVVVGEVMPLREDAPESVPRQWIMDAGMAHALLGGLQGWAERVRGQLPVGVADQLDQIRADARRRFKQGAAELERAEPGVYGPDGG